jgi:hypothetical protein
LTTSSVVDRWCHDLDMHQFIAAQSRDRDRGLLAPADVEADADRPEILDTERLGVGDWPSAEG